jgi:CRP-like cAMP-binding protein
LSPRAVRRAEHLEYRVVGEPRSADVYAATDGVRVLSLSESTIRRLIESDADVAARLLLNISKILCLRLLQSA